jgi:TonB-linked SusC/RagA family outer membrane protein
MYKIFTKCLCNPPLCIRKALLIMKLTVILLIASIMQISASTLAQNVTYTKKGATLAQVFKEVRKQTGYNVIWNLEQLNGSLKIDAQFNNASLDNVMNECLRDKPLTFVIQEKTVVIKTKSFLDNTINKLQKLFKDINVHGRVVDNEGNGLLGASIKVKDESKIATTDEKGNFSLDKIDENSVLVISYVGYLTKEINASSDLAKIILETSNSKLDAVTVIGYGTTTKRIATNNILSIGAATIAEQPVSNPIMALEGRTPGVLITQSSGLPGADIAITIRGLNSINSGTGPLYVIDGVPVESYTQPTEYQSSVGGRSVSPLNTINPADIASIDILKDADGTAIYGSRGANGVILITTKKGKKGPTKFSVDYYSGVSKIDHFMDFLNTPQYLALRRQAFAADGITPTTDNAPDLLVWDQNTNTKWQKLLYGNNNNVNDVQASASGGDDNTRFFMNGGYHNEGSVLDGNGYDRRFNFHLNLDHDFDKKKGNITTNISYGNDNIRSPLQDPYGAINAPPNMPLYNPDGSLYWLSSSQQNPLSYLKSYSLIQTDNFIGNLTINYKLLPNLNFKLSTGYTKRNQAQTNLQPSTSLNPYIDYGYNNSSEFINNKVQTYTVEPQLNYSTVLGKAKISALLGGTLQGSSAGSEDLQVGGFSSDALLQNASAASTAIYYATGSDAYKYASLFGRLTYNLDDKYIINGVYRRDGSSRFGPGKQYGDFWSLGGAWVFSQEQFIKNNLPFISFGKLRGSYGLVGNDQISDYQYLQTYSSTYPYQGVSGLIPKQLANPDYSWEVNRKLEFGLEFGLFNNRINLTTSWFRNHSDNQLVSYPLASQTGFTSYTANFPALIENKGWEFELETKNIRSKDFSWNTSFNLTISRNKLLKFPGLDSSPYYGSLEIGQPLNVFLNLHFTGVDPKTGIPNFQDVDKDGQISYPNDYTSPVSSDPKYYGGIGNTFSYKNVSLDVFFQFEKRELLDYSGIFNAAGFMYNVTTSVANNVWMAPGNITSLPRLTTTYGTPAESAYENYTSSDAIYSDASFVRLKNVSLSYTLPSTFVKSIGFDNIKFFIQGQNLLTFTKYKGVDPETGSFTPPLRTISAGFHFTF